jgi:hypothetical protein
MSTYLRLGGCSIIIAVWSSAQRSTETAFRTDSKSSALSQVFLALRLSDFDLLLLAATAEFFRLEGILRLELCAAVFRNISVGHSCGSLVLFGFLRDESKTG